MTLPRSALLAALMAAGLGLGATSAQATVLLLDLNFDSPAIADTDTPDAAASVHGLPVGTSVTQPGATNSWVNIRRHDNGIDGGAAANNNFDNSFTAGNFLVLGDSTGNLGGDTSGTSSISIPFSIPVAGTSLTISYDWVFDTNNTVVSDDFNVDLVGSVLTGVQAVAAPVRNGSTRGAYTQTFTGAALTALLGTNQALRFQLVEYVDSTASASSAVGIDNIRVSFEPTSVPEPASLALLGIGLLGLGALRRRGVARA